MGATHQEQQLRWPAQGRQNARNPQGAPEANGGESCGHHYREKIERRQIGQGNGVGSKVNDNKKWKERAQSNWNGEERSESSNSKGAKNQSSKSKGFQKDSRT